MIYKSLKIEPVSPLVFISVLEIEEWESKSGGEQE